MDELLSGTAVRVRVSASMGRPGRNSQGSGRWTMGRAPDIHELDIERVPELVSTIVAMGGRVYEDARRGTQTPEDHSQLL